jgi:hypothetical protein
MLKVDKEVVLRALLADGWPELYATIQVNCMRKYDARLEGVTVPLIMETTHRDFWNAIVEITAVCDLQWLEAAVVCLA